MWGEVEETKEYQTSSHTLFNSVLLLLIIHRLMSGMLQLTSVQ